LALVQFKRPNNPYASKQPLCVQTTLMRPLYTISTRFCVLHQWSDNVHVSIV